jgi:drug/metabolite transporter (DMT)-like permease
VKAFRLALNFLPRQARSMADARPHQQHLLGIALRIGAATTFATMALAIKLAYAHGVSTIEVCFYRSAFALPIVLLWILANRNFGAWRTKHPLSHAWRSAVGLTSMLLSFTALFYLPLAEATTIGFAAPLFAVILSALVLKEKVGRHRWSAVAIGLAGVFLVMRPHGGALPAIGLTVAILAALATSVASITIRQIGRHEATPTLVFWFTLLSTLAVGLLMPWAARGHDGTTWMILLGVGACGGVAQLLMTASLRFAPVSTVVPFDYVQLLWAVTFGLLLFAQHPAPTTWAGAAIIVASGLYTLHRERVLGRAKTEPAPAV